MAARGLPRRVGSIAVDPFDSSRVLIGGVGFGRVSSDDDCWCRRGRHIDFGFAWLSHVVILAGGAAFSVGLKSHL